MIKKTGRKKTAATRAIARQAAKFPASAKNTPQKNKSRTSAKTKSQKNKILKKSKFAGMETPSAISASSAAPQKRVLPTRKTPFGAKELRQYQELLLKLRAQLTGQISSLVQDSLSLAPGEGDLARRSEEDGTESSQRDFVLARASSNQDVVFEIDEAIHRIANKSFGICEGCLKNVEKPRLQALPYSRLCVRCKSEWEQTKQHSRRSLESGSLFALSDRNMLESGDEE